MDLSCLEKKHELENTYRFITTEGLQATLQYLAHNRDISQWTEQWDSCRQLHRDAHIEVAPKIPLTCKFYFLKWLVRYCKLSLDLTEPRKSLKWPPQYAMCFTYQLTLESPYWISQKKRHKKARSNIYVTSHICSCNCFPVGCFQWRRKPDWKGIQQWITIPLLEISKFSWGKPRRTADPQRAAVRTTEKSNAGLWQSVYRSLGRKGKRGKPPLRTSYVRT